MPAVHDRAQPRAAGGGGREQGPRFRTWIRDSRSRETSWMSPVLATNPFHLTLAAGHLTTLIHEEGEEVAKGPGWAVFSSGGGGRRKVQEERGPCPE